MHDSSASIDGGHKLYGENFEDEDGNRREEVVGFGLNGQHSVIVMNPSIYRVKMAKQEEVLQFGDKNTADLKVHLIDLDGTDYGGNPLYLHSRVLRKSEFYETMLYDRWSSQPPLEIKVRNGYGGENHVKCIQLMYSSQTHKRFSFSGVDEALSILPVASELLFHDCVKECMRYLEAVRWSAEQEAQLRVLVTSLQINIFPELAARLGMSVCKPEDLQMLEGSVQEMLCMIRKSSDHRTTLEKYIVACMKVANASSLVADTWRSALLKEFKENVECIKNEANKETMEKDCSTLSWLVDVIQRCDREAFETILFRTFCEDDDLRNALGHDRISSKQAKIDVRHVLIDQFLKGLGNGEIIAPSSLRISFLSNWLSTMAGLVNDIDSGWAERFDDLERGMIDVAETLPLVERRRIYNIWKDAL